MLIISKKFSNKHELYENRLCEGHNSHKDVSDFIPIINRILKMYLPNFSL